MPLDDPYDLDFFQTITDCQFGSSWFGVVGPRSGGGPTRFEIDFPNMAGSTPGFIPVLDNIVPVFAPYTRNPGTAPFTITAADLTRKITADAGKQYNCFAINQIDAFGGAMMIFNMKDFPSTTFKVRVRFDVNNDVGVFCIARNKMKAGLRFTSSFDLPLAGNVYAACPAGFQDYAINPSTLQVTGPL